MAKGWSGEYSHDEDVIIDPSCSGFFVRLITCLAIEVEVGFGVSLVVHEEILLA